MRRCSAGVWIVLISVLVAGCGYKTNPRPAAATIPAEIGLVHAHAYSDRIVLRWDVPQHNIDGSPLKDLSGFKVYRVAERIGEECEDCKDRKGVPINIDFQHPSNAVIERGEVVFSDRDVSPDTVYRYSVGAYNLNGREGRASEEVTVVFDEPPPRPDGLEATVDPKGVRLEWAPPGRLGGLRSYSIYRGANDKPEDMKAIGRTKWAETFYVDETVEREKMYYYSVRSIKMNRGIPLESDASQAAKVFVPQVPLSPPENVGVTAVPGGIRVYWDSVKIESEQIRYNVYRSESGGMFGKVNGEPIAQPQFLDRNVQGRKTYRYAVTAFPKEEPERESSRSGSEAVTYNP